MKKYAVNCTSALLFYLILHSTFFKGKVGFLVFFLFFLSEFFKKNLVVSLVGFNYINTEDNYGRLIEFLSQISKLSYLIL